jgi:hypothetical protein
MLITKRPLNELMARVTLAIVVVVSASNHRHRASASDKLFDQLIAAYRTAPQGYPKGRQYAPPDTSDWFRWHWYNDDAIERYEDVEMLTHVEPYNTLEGGDVSVDYRSTVSFEFIREHTSIGKRALKVRFPESAIKNEHAVRIGVQGPNYLGDPKRRQHAVAAYWSHFRWLKLDLFNPYERALAVKVMHVPFVVRPGASTIAVKTADAVGYRGQWSSLAHEVRVAVTRGPPDGVTLFIDNVRMEQEVPKTFREQGRMFHFTARAAPKAPTVLWPGFTSVDDSLLYTRQRGFGWIKTKQKRRSTGNLFRSTANGFLCCKCEKVDAPFRVDLPNGRWGVYVFAYPGRGWAENQLAKDGLTIQLNAHSHEIYPALDDDEAHRLAYSGESWSYRPGACVWEELIRAPFYPEANIAFANVDNGRLLIEVPDNVPLRAIMMFPVEAEDAAVNELGRFNYLLAESWDVSQPWVKATYISGAFTGPSRYIGSHEEAEHRERIPKKLQALKLGSADFRRGFALFNRGLTEAVYPDTIPSAEEVVACRRLARSPEEPGEANGKQSGSDALYGIATPGASTCITLSVLPLTTVRGVKVAVGDLISDQGTRVPATQVDVRVSRQHHKTMNYGHENDAHNLQEYYLVRHDRIDLHPGSARRIYFDTHIPSNTKAGKYRGQVQLTVGGEVVVTALVLEVQPFKLQEPPIHLAGTWTHPELKKYGFNTVATSYDAAIRERWRGYTGRSHSFLGTRVGLNDYEGGLASLTKVTDVALPLIAQGKAGKGPRGFFSAYYWKPVNDNEVKQVQTSYPDLDILGVTIPIFSLTATFNHELQLFGGPLRKATPEALEKARSSGKDFWFVDALRYSKEQPARFTWGLWLWRSGATGRGTTLGARFSQVGSNSYYTHSSGNCANVDRVLIDSAIKGELNPCRDLILIREGIDDYRYIYTLERLIENTRRKQSDGDALAAAKAFRDRLYRDVTIDLTEYYETRGHAQSVTYAENWYPKKGNPWTGKKLEVIRRQCASHIVALRELLKS